MVFELIATLASGLFAGAAGYISLVEHFARVQAGPAVALAEFRPGFPRARAIQASLALLSGASGAGAFFATGTFAWLFVSVLMFGVVGFTLVAITPLYNRLLEPSLTADSPEAVPTLVRWGSLHHVRSVAALAAFVVALATLSGSGG